jgi:UrcA family protein
MLLRSLPPTLALAGAAFCVASAVKAAPVQVAADPHRVSVYLYSTAVQRSDLDLSTASGQEQLLVRIQQAAGRVCRAARFEPPVLWGAPVQSTPECLREATERALTTMDVPGVTALYRRQLAAPIRR